LLVVALMALWMYLAPVLSAGSGYAAKNICSGHFLSGMSGRTIVDQALVGASPLLANVSFEIDRDASQVKTRLFGLFPRTAVFARGTGCTLLPAGGSTSGHRVRVARHQIQNAEMPWPMGSAAPSIRPELNDIVRDGFVEKDASAPLNTKAIVVVHEGRLVAEHYADGISVETPLIGWSMTKSVTNLLIGLLVADGKLVISEPAPVPQWRERKGDLRGRITTDQLLRMSSGLEFDEEYGLFSDVTRMLSNEPDMARFAASKPLAEPSRRPWSYSSGTTNILAGIVRRTVGGGTQEYYDFAQQRLFQPLGIHTATLELDAAGTFVGSSYMYASARDWARLGQFCLLGGRWQQQQFLPDQWMAYSTTPTPNNPSNNYGAHFWLNRSPEDPSKARIWTALPEDSFVMDGYQGQNVVMIPSEKLVVVRLGFTPAENHQMAALVSRLLDALSTHDLNRE